VRSQMAEAFLRDYAGNFFNVYSAGLNPKPIHPYTIQVMKEHGIDCSQQVAKSITRFLGRQSFDCVITLSNEAAHYDLTLLPGINNHLHWLFEDPAVCGGTQEEKLNKFREVRDQIEQKLLNWLNQIQPEKIKSYQTIDY